MDGQASRGLWALQAPIPARWVAVIAYTLVFTVFLGDWFTPTTLVAGVAYEAPVVFAALKGTRHLTILTVALGSFGVLLGWFVDFAQASYQFSEVRLENRFLSVVSIWIVGWLALVVQEKAERERQLLRIEAARREGALSSAVDRVMSALSPGTTIQAITAEAPGMLGAETAVWCATEPGAASWVAAEGSSEAKSFEIHESPSFTSLLQRLSAQRSVEVVNAADSIDYLLGKPLGLKNALAIPIRDAARVVGVVFVSVKAPAIDEHALASAENFARFASSAVQQAEFAHDPARRTNPAIG